MANAEDQRDSGWIPRSGNGHPLQYYLPGKSHGWGSLAGCSPREVAERNKILSSVVTHPPRVKGEKKEYISEWKECQNMLEKEYMG